MADDLASSNASNCPLIRQALAYRADRSSHLVTTRRSLSGYPYLLRTAISIAISYLVMSIFLSCPA